MKKKNGTKTKNFTEMFCHFKKKYYLCTRNRGDKN